jgi:lauroyl/myristoyl acyltransferase
VVCLLGDRDMTRAGVKVTFFGEPTTMPAGPALLAATTGAALLPASLWFDGDGWAHRIGAPIPVPAAGRLRDRVTVATQALADWFGAEIAAHPADWHMLQRLWLADLGPQRGAASGSDHDRPDTVELAGREPVGPVRPGRSGQRGPEDSGED